MRPHLLPLTLASLALAQSNSSATNSTSGSPLFAVPASGNSSLSALSSNSTNATLSIGWNSPKGAGAFSDRLVKLLDGDGSSTAVNLTYNSELYGLLLKFDATAAANQTRSPVPFFALINCDNSTYNATQTLNTTAPLTNGTAASNSSSSVVLSDAFALAAKLDATLAILYSQLNQTCTIDPAYLASNESKPLEVWASPSLATTSLLLEQFAHVESNATDFNSTLLTQLAPNLTAALATGTLTAVEQVGFLVAQLAVQNATGNSTGADSGPVVVSIAPAPTATGKGSVGSVGQSSTSGASKLVNGAGGWLVASATVAVGAWSGWVLLG